MDHRSFVVQPDETILITGATGFIGSRVVRRLLDRGFSRIRCVARPSSDLSGLNAVRSMYGGARVELITGNLLCRQDCLAATRSAVTIFHLAAAREERSIPHAFMNSVVTTRNLLDAALRHGSLQRFVSISSFTVYTNAQRARRRPLDETCPIETRPSLRGNAYCFAKVKQDEIVADYGEKFGVPYVIIRPGYVYGPGNEAITHRVGIGTFGVFLHLGGGNTIPLTYVDNCAEAIVRAGLLKGVDGQVFNVVDDDLPSSRAFLRQYKRNVRRFTSLYVPHAVSYALCALWEKYSYWSEGQLPPTFNRRNWRTFWKKTRYSNAKLKASLGWVQEISTADGMALYFASCREKARRA